MPTYLPDRPLELFRQPDNTTHGSKGPSKVIRCLSFLHLSECNSSVELGHSPMPPFVLCYASYSPNRTQ